MAQAAQAIRPARRVRSAAYFPVDLVTARVLVQRGTVAKGLAPRAAVGDRARRGDGAWRGRRPRQRVPAGARCLDGKFHGVSPKGTRLNRSRAPPARVRTPPTPAE